MMERQFKKPSARKKLNMDFIENDSYGDENQNNLKHDDVTNKTELFQNSEMGTSSKNTSCCTEDKSTVSQANMLDITNTSLISPKLYKLRGQSKNKKYFESDNDSEDFSPDCSEYLPSPDRNISSSRSNSSLGGDTHIIENLVNNVDMSRSPSTISNLSSLLENTDFIASESVVYPVSFNSPKPMQKKQNSITYYDDSNMLIDISLKDITSDLRVTNSKPASPENLQTADNTLTLTPDSTSKSDSFILNDDTMINPQSTGNTLTSDDTSRNDSVTANNDTIIVNEKDTTNTTTNNSETKIDMIQNKISNTTPARTFQIVLTIEPEESMPENEGSECSVIKNENISQEKHQGTPTSSPLRTELTNSNSNGPNINIEDNQINDALDTYQSVEPSLNAVVEPNILYEPSPNIDIIDQEASTSKSLTRKRKRDPIDWIDSKNKLLKNSGQAYEGARSKKTFPAKTILASCECRLRCGFKITEEQRKSIHEHFYKLAKREDQWLYVAKNVKVENVKRITVERKLNRTQTIQYFFTVDGEKIRVCRKYFTNTLNITEQMIYTAIEKYKNEDCFQDKRGMHENRPHKMKPETEESIITHINVFPKIESHYIRQESQREYLSELLNISKMYRLYKIWFAAQDYDNVQMATKRQYETIFNTRFNLSFFRPKKDQCTLCAQYEQADVTGKVIIEEEYQKHLKMKDRIREIKNEEKKTLDKEKGAIAIYDMQKVLYVPQSEVSDFHYKRKYPVYNFTIFDALRKCGYCYVWHAQIGKKGCTEVGSGLLQYLKAQAEKGIHQFSFYSDGCYGQNKNRYIFALYLYAAINYQVDITHRFFIKGHSQNEGDSMHSCIERNMRNQVLYTPDQVYGVITNSKISGEKYVVKEMEQSDFLNIKELVEEKRWHKDKNGTIIRWSDIMEVHVSRTKPNCFFFKYNFDEEYSELDLFPDQGTRGARGNRRGRGAKSTQGSSGPARQTVQPAPIFENVELKPAYNKPFPVSYLVFEDLKKLCQIEAIPRHYHAFYESIPFEPKKVRKTGENSNSNSRDT